MHNPEAKLIFAFVVAPVADKDIKDFYVASERGIMECREFILAGL